MAKLPNSFTPRSWSVVIDLSLSRRCAPPYIERGFLGANQRRSDWRSVNSSELCRDIKISNAVFGAMQVA